MNAKNNKTNETKATFLVKTILEKTTKNLKSSAGRNESIYKKEVFEGCENKKNLRAKLRKVLENFAKTIIQEEKNKTKLNALIKDFNEFYQAFYLINDYSLNSLCSNNTDEQTKENYKKMLDIINNNNN